ncbi:tetratricopeptide repeat protein [Shouchella tritolerans]|uniref:tetratricopeptide repeat protein n=1 Tax=Shouchella tritolerans TaxID=2979466 RepID=UPI0021E8FC1F|nr:hypothetical protein [Shouchella tritolerans]
MGLLKMSVQENPADDRNMHYLGREYMYYRDWDKCIETLKKHLNMPSARWVEERCASMRYIARAFKEKGEYTEASRWLYKAIAEAPHTREPFVEMAKLAYEQRDWPRVYHMVEATLQIEKRNDRYINEAFAWDATIYDLGALASYELGMLERSCTYARMAAELAPKDERIQNNYRIILEKVRSSN